MTIERKPRKTQEGIVSSCAMDKTVTVVVNQFKMHSRYKKYIKLQKKYMAHDEDNTCQLGDRVLISQTRPLSKRKHWRVAKILQRGT